MDLFLLINTMKMIVSIFLNDHRTGKGEDGVCTVVNSECGMKNTEGNCRSGCKHTGNDTTSSCIVDECGKYTIEECVNKN
jgi:hypothetical protein